ncbi:MAG: hypothetical protein HYY06_30460 [Deltaproteobacteria bacterium]|nr:hypothetical protein [Deltaproteobacteria bacterium]
MLVLLLLASGPALANDLVIVEPGPPPSPRQRATLQAGPVDLWAGALVQLDAGRGGERQGFFLRRSRLRFGGRLERLVSLGLRLEIELNPIADPAGLLDAVVEFRVASRGLADLGRLELGQMKVPLSQEVMDAPEDLAFVERAQGARLIAPGRDAGVLYTLPLLRGEGRAASVPRAQLRFGLFNGEGAGELGGGGGSATLLRLDGGVGDPSRARVGGRWGFALWSNPDSPVGAGIQSATIAGADLTLWYRALRAGAELLWRDAADGSQSRAVWAWASYDVIADILQLRGRAETLDDGVLTRRVTLGATFHYLPDRFRLLYDLTVPLDPVGNASVAHVTSFMAVL